MNENLMIASSLTLLLFAALSIFDGLFFHLWKFRLQERDESKFEHITHTIRAVLFIPTLVLIYFTGVAGFWLWAALAILAADLVTEVIDVLDERRSRMSLGGLPSAEYLIHIMLTTLRGTALSLAFAALPAEAWNVTSVVALTLPEMSKLVVLQILPGAVVVAGLHIYLIFDPRLVSRLEAIVRRQCCPVVKL